MDDLQSESGVVFWDGLGFENPASGIYQHGRRLAEELGRLGIHPIILKAKMDPSLTGRNREVVIGGVGVSRRGRKNKLLWPNKVGRVVSQCVRQPCILHGLSNINTPLFSEKSKTIRRVSTIHDLIPLKTNRNSSYGVYLRLVLPFLLRRVDRVVCVSNWTAKHLSEWLPEVSSKVIVIPNGYRPLRPSSKRTDQDGGTRVLTISRFEDYKRLDILVKIFFSMPASYHFHVVTDTQGVRFLQERATHLIAEGRLNLYQGLPQEELEELFQVSHIYLHTSEWEGFCLPASEALSWGLPVVYHKGSGMDEVVGNEFGVSIAKGAGIDEWVCGTEKASSLVNDPTFTERLDSYLRNKPSWGEVAHQYKQIYDNLLVDVL